MPGFKSIKWIFFLSASFDLRTVSSGCLSLHVLLKKPWSFQSDTYLFEQHIFCEMSRVAFFATRDRLLLKDEGVWTQSSLVTVCCLFYIFYTVLFLAQEITNIYIHCSPKVWKHPWQSVVLDDISISFFGANTLKYLDIIIEDQQ